jgi:uncharacterized protein (DUF1330 family)
VPLAQAAIKAAGGRILAAGQNITPTEGTPPKRASIRQLESVEQYNAYRKSAAFVDARKIGDKPELCHRGHAAIVHASCLCLSMSQHVNEAAQARSIGEKLEISPSRSKLVTANHIEIIGAT